MNLSVTPSQQSCQPHRTVLDNGITILVVENPASDIIAARIFLQAGSRHNSWSQAGLANLVASVLTKGADNLSSMEIAEWVESVGASLGTDVAADYFLLSLKTVSADFAQMLGLAGKLLRSPTFPEAEVELERRLTLQALRSQQEQPFTVALKALREGIYQQHPYGISTMGTPDSICHLTCEDLQAFHQTYFRPDNLIISISGRLSIAEAIALVRQVFDDWEIPAMPLPKNQTIAINSQPHLIITPQETQQSIVMLGYPAPSIRSQDYGTLKLLNTYLGNGLSSRLFVELREKRGLAYDVSAFYPTRTETSHFVVYMGTAPGNVEIARLGLQQEVERLCTTQLTPQELQASQHKLLGQYALGKQTNSQIAHLFGWYETLGLGVEFEARFQAEISSVTAQNIWEVTNQYLTDPYTSLLGPEEVVRSATS